MTITETASLVRLRLTTHNARLVDARKERGLTGEDMAASTKLPRGRLRDIENLRAIPREEEMVNIACILEKPIDYLFPEELLSAVATGVFSRRKAELDAPQVIYLTQVRRQDLLTDGGFEHEVDRKLLSERIHEVMGALHPREQRVLSLRFGLEDGKARLLEEVGMKMGVTKERIRQIEAKALHKLRHPSRSRKLKDFLD